MEAILAILIPALIQAGVQEAPIIAGLITTHAQLQKDGRADVADAVLTQLKALLTSTQAAIDSAAAVATGAPQQLG